MMKHTITVLVKPKVKDRPRMTRRGRVFTPKRTLEYEAVIADAWDGPVFEGPVSMDITLENNQVTITVSDTIVKPTALRGDIDNYVKSIMDGLNGVAYVDDKQVRKLKVVKK